MGFFKKIGKGISKGFKAVTKVTGKVLKTVAPVASVIPGVGSIVSAAGSVVGSVLDPDKQEKIVEAVEEQGVVKVDKIEKTIISENPEIDASTLQAATKEMTGMSLKRSPSATVDDSKSITTVSSGTKVIQWIKKNFLLLGGGLLGFILLTKKGGKRSYRRF